MAKEELLTLDGEIEEVLPDGRFGLDRIPHGAQVNFAQRIDILTGWLARKGKS